jgi:excisionase family DNA binding protein
LRFLAHILLVKISKNWEKAGKDMSLLDKDVVLTTKEAMKYLKISKPTFLKYVRSEKIRAIKVGNAWRVHQSELYRFLKIGKIE